MTIECPYCQHEYDPEMNDGGDWSQDARREEECPECEKNFMITVSWEVSFESEKADCLNGGAHRLKEEWHTDAVVKVPQIACTACGHVTQQRELQPMPWHEA